MKFRKTTLADIQLTYQWANDPLVREQSYSTDDISLANHRRWFENKLGDAAALHLIFEVEDEPIGLVRFDKADDHYVIGVTVAPEARGNGYASRMLRMGLQRFKSHADTEVYAYIKNQNTASIKAFEKAGFRFEKDLELSNIASKLYIWK